jgi:uncharacterized protein (TIGR03000 family)
MRRVPLAAAAVMLLAAGPVIAQHAGTVQPLPFTPYVPPVHCTGRVGRDYINCVIPDNRVLAGASFYSTAFEPIYNRLYGPRVAVYADLSPAPPPPPPAPPPDPTRAIITLEVIDTAEVFIEDQLMTQTGRKRQFVSPTLIDGDNYRYNVRVRWSDQGQPRERKLRIPVQAGDRPVVAVLR